MKRSGHLLFALSASAAFATAVQSQQVTLNFDDLNPCNNTPVSSYQGWIALSAGVTCNASPWGWTSPSSNPNYLTAFRSMDFTFLGGPVAFNGFYTSGFATYFLELLSGGTTVYSTYFSALGSPYNVTPGYGGTIDEVRVNVWFGSAVIGVDDISFTPTNPGGPPPGVENVPPNDGGNEGVGGDPTVTPEPASLLLLASGLGGLGALVKRRRKVPTPSTP